MLVISKNLVVLCQSNKATCNLIKSLFVNFCFFFWWLATTLPDLLNKSINHFVFFCLSGAAMLILLLCFYMLVAHWLACIWYSIGRSDSENYLTYSWLWKLGNVTQVWLYFIHFLPSFPSFLCRSLTLYRTVTYQFFYYKLKFVALMTSVINSFECDHQIHICHIHVYWHDKTQTHKVS